MEEAREGVESSLQNGMRQVNSSSFCSINNRLLMVSKTLLNSFEICNEEEMLSEILLCSTEWYCTETEYFEDRSNLHKEIE